MAQSRARTIILNIYQPNSQIVKLFNSVLLLADESILHHGSLDQLASHLSSDLDLQIPPHVKTLEFAIDSINILFSQTQHQTPDPHHHHHHQLRVHSIKSDRCMLQQLFQQHKVIDEEFLVDDEESDSSNDSGDAYKYEYANSRIREVGILAHQFYNNVSRTRQLFACRTVTMLVSGLILGSIFYRLDDYDIRGRVGLFAFILTFLLSCTTEIGTIQLIVAMDVSAFVKWQRRSGTTDTAISAFLSLLLIPQLMIIGLFEAFNNISQLEFYYKQFPKNMRSIGRSLLFSGLAISNYLSRFHVTVVHQTTGGYEKNSWLPEDLNKGRLDFFHPLIAAIGVANFFWFIVCGKWYRYKGLEDSEEVASKSSVTLV